MSPKTVLYVKIGIQPRWITAARKGKNMSEEENKSLKIRVKFPSGAEFEAEGTREFIEQQRTWFLAQLDGKAPAPRTPRPSIASAGERPSAAPTQLPPSVSKPLPDKAMWERILKTEGGLVYPRRKYRQLTPETAALLLIAGAKTLLGAVNGYSALDLSKSLKLAGFGEGRLDRLLAADLRAGTLKTTGTKRGRAYILSDEGFARAFVLAEKLDQASAASF